MPRFVEHHKMKYWTVSSSVSPTRILELGRSMIGPPRMNFNHTSSPTWIAGSWIKYSAPCSPTKDIRHGRCSGKLQHADMTSEKEDIRPHGYSFLWLVSLEWCSQPHPFFYHGAFDTRPKVGFWREKYTVFFSTTTGWPTLNNALTITIPSTPCMLDGRELAEITTTSWNLE